ncbi:hypothetical protein V3W47_08510 [Deinococcus sp. YIM 134068]|uniref:hypothetical protein n=1 Tax=Deinococcus lichenicola TaxID=3118910 RepID=UPI002F933D5E
MRGGRLGTAGLLLLAGLNGGGAAAQTGIVSLIDTNIAPNTRFYRNRALIEVIDLQLLRRWRDQGCKIGAQPSSTCPTFEFSVPFLLDPTGLQKSSLDVSRDLGGVMQYEWQRFQDRTRWAVSMDLNKSISAATALPALPYATRPLGCTPGLNVAGEVAITAAKLLAGNPGDITSTPAPYALSVPAGSTNPNFRLPSSLSYGMKDDGVALPNYPYPRVSRTQYCPGREMPKVLPDSAYPLPGSVYMPNTSVYGVGGLKYPLPLAFNWGEVRSRIRNACNQAVKQYYKEYVDNVLKAVATKMQGSMHWNGYTSWQGNRSGVIFAPVAGNVPNAAKVVGLASKAQTPQFADYLTVRTPASQLVSNQARASGKLVQLEDLKRWLEVGTLRDTATQGSVNLFQTWQQLLKVVDKRPLTFYAHARSCTFWGCTIVPVPMLMPDTVVNPTGCTVASTAGGLGTMTFTLPVARFAWVSVPEGFPIPGLNGHPELRLQ